MHEKIETTLAKAKALRPHIEKLVTVASKAVKSNDKIKKFNAVKKLSKSAAGPATRKLINEIAERFLNTPGGYTRIVKIGNRDGDNAQMARIEFVTKAVKKLSKKKVRSTPAFSSENVAEVKKEQKDE